MNAVAQAKLEIDGLVLKRVKRRFMAINKDRMKRVHLALGDRQKIFIEVLPLLFHINHPMLPGYLTSKTPAGVAEYTPTKVSIAAAQRLAKSFTYKKTLRHDSKIKALYLMGSGGTIAYSRKSDFDIWLCVGADLNEEERELLTRKVEAVESWAASIGLEVHFFMMHDESFRDGTVETLSQESSGTAQHHLLLDEFYRTSLLVAGRYPIWWLVPADYEGDYSSYVHNLKHKRFVKPNETLDFGGLDQFPVEELFGATLWQLYKAVGSPYKSALKIMLMEAYADEYPDVEMLSVRFKRSVYEAELTLDEMDPYVMMCNRVEEYLFAHHDLDRLELARRCFYFKVSERMSRPDRSGNISWRRELMREIVTDWSWDQPHLLMLDSRDTWKIHRVQEERTTLVNALTSSYKALSDFARKNSESHAINPVELNLLGRRLYAAFDRKAGKVDIINPGISKDLTESKLSLHQLQGKERDGWVLYRGDVRPGETGNDKPLKRAHSLVEILAWSHFNQLIDPMATMIRIYPEECSVGSWEVRSIVECLQQLYPEGKVEESTMDDLALPACPRNGALFINLGIDPMEKLSREGVQLVSSRTDALSYGGRWENLTVTLDQIITTSWKEVLTFHYAGPDALMDCMCDYLAWVPLSTKLMPAEIPAYSFSSTRGAPISRRVEELFKDVVQCFYKHPMRHSLRYVVQVGHAYYIMQGEDDVPRYRKVRGEKTLYKDLGAPQAAFSPIHLDGHTMENTAFAAMVKANKPGVVQLFYEVDRDHANVFVLDEMGSLFYQQVEFHDNLTLLTQFQRFLESVQHRRDFLAREAGLIAQTGSIEFYQVIGKPTSPKRLERQNISPFSHSENYFGVQVIGDVNEKNRVVFTMYCGEQEFSTLEHGEHLFREVARHVIKQRAGGQTYPIYITDIDLSRNLLGSENIKGLQSILFLNYKKRIEARLNQALNSL